jgi:hypothetical protein
MEEARHRHATRTLRPYQLNRAHGRGSTFLVIGLSREVSICDLAAIATPRVTPLRSLVLSNELNPRGYLQVNGELHVVGSLMRRGEGMSYSTQVYKCDVFCRDPRWLRVKDTGDMTLFVSKILMTGLSGASIFGLTKNSVYFSEHVDEPQEDLDHELEISDVDNGTSEFLPYHNKTPQCSSAALCWIQPKPHPWTEGTSIHLYQIN